MTDATVEEATHTLAITVDDESEMVGYFDNVSCYRPSREHSTIYSRLCPYVKYTHTPSLLEQLGELLLEIFYVM